MHSGAVLLLVERPGYRQVRNLLRNIRVIAEGQEVGEMIVNPDIRREFNCEYLYEHMPPVLTECLFIKPSQATEGDFERKMVLKKKLAYYCLAIRKH